MSLGSYWSAFGTWQFAVIRLVCFGCICRSFDGAMILRSRSLHMTYDDDDSCSLVGDGLRIQGQGKRAWIWEDRAR